MRLYATVDDLVPDYLDKAPDNAKRLIRDASLLIEDATLLARYSVDDEGYPTTKAIADAFTAATCFQVAAWKSAGIDPAKGAIGQDLRVGTQSAGGGSVSYVGIATNEDIAKALSAPCASSMRVLRGVGLLNTSVGYLG